MDEIAFLKFPKIYENTGEFKAPKKIEWIATEKIDGSNFSVYSDGKKVKFAKRTGFIKEDDWFYNYQLIALDLSKKAKKVYENLNSAKLSPKQLKYIVIYGELCGGWYPSDENWTGPVPSRINAKGHVIVPLEQRAVQEGVYYSDKIQLIVFDIVWVDQNNKFQYLEYDSMSSCAKEVGLYFTPPLARASLPKLLDYSLEFDSTIPPMFGLPRIHNNTAEGIVIRPASWPGPGQDRPMLKRKNKRFHQFSGDFDHHAVKTNPFFVATCMINQNRLNGVISKVGAKAEKSVILEELVQDVWESIWELGIPVQNYEEVDAHIRKISESIVQEFIDEL
ncbi:RNA ligase [Histomonas meleagridis]|uniref:RNA ligase n=1 Tax=Histomonas meleagridis TaxID=135588 RepID=UPI00355A891A|nr:RNA ligase [Histomonas meleagridis]